MIVGCTLDYYIIHVLLIKVTTKGKRYYIKIKNKTKNKTKKQKNKKTKKQKNNNNNKLNK